MTAHGSGRVDGQLLILTFAMAGALAVPWSAAGTPLAAAAAGLLGAVGLRLRRWSRLPERHSTEPAASGFWRLLGPARWLAVGLGVGSVVLAVLRLGIEPAVPAIGARIAAAGALPIRRRLVIIYVAAVGEELLFRLMLLSAIAGLAARLSREKGRPPSALAVWIANALAAAVFAAAHLPAWQAVGATTPALVAAILGLNAAGALVFGQVFATRGIVAAIWAHAGADCVIQLLGPLTR